MHIAYRGWADCVAALTSGEIDLMFDNLSTALPNVQRRQDARAGASRRQTRHRSLPDVPTLAEAGVNDAEVMSWFGDHGAQRHAAAGRSTRLAATFKVIAEKPEFKRLINDQGMDATYYGGAEA